MYRNKLVYKIEEMKRRIEEIKQDNETKKYLEVFTNQLIDNEEELQLFDYIETNKTIDIPKELFTSLTEIQAVYLANIKQAKIYIKALNILKDNFDSIFKKFENKVYNKRFDTFIKSLDNEISFYITKKSYEKDFYICITNTRQNQAYKYNRKMDYTQYTENQINNLQIVFKLDLDGRLILESLKENINLLIQVQNNNIETYTNKFLNYYVNINGLENAKLEIQEILKKYTFDNSQDKKELIEFIQYHCIK